MKEVSSSISHQYVAPYAVTLGAYFAAALSNKASFSAISTSNWCFGSTFLSSLHAISKSSPAAVAHGRTL